jgi:LysM repeat protein
MRLVTSAKRAELVNKSTYTLCRSVKTKSCAVLFVYSLSMLTPVGDAYSAAVEKTDVGVSQKKPAGYILLIMHKGDTLETVARQYSLKASELVQANQAFAGQWATSTLLVPSSTIVDSSVFHPIYSLHIVRSDETLSSIAAHYNRSVKELVNLNSTVMPKSQIGALKAGQYLLVPALPTPPLTHDSGPRPTE